MSPLSAFSVPLRRWTLFILIPVFLVVGTGLAAEVHSRVDGQGLIAKDPQDPAAYIQFSDFLLSKGNTKEAQEILEVGRNKAHPSADLLVALCRVYEARDKTAKAEAMALEALEVDPKHSEANICLGEIYFKMGWQNSANDAFARAVALDPEGTRPKVKLLGGLMASGKLNEAENKCQEFLSVDAGNVDLWLSLGQVFEKKGERKAAFATYGQVLTIDSQNSMAFGRQGRLFCEFGQFSAAETACKRALELDPDNGLAHAYLGIAFSYLGDSERAREHSMKAEAAGMNMTVVWKKIGR